MNAALLSSKKMDYCTPQAFFDALNREFRFTLDAAATAKSAKCPAYYTPETAGLQAPLWAEDRAMGPQGIRRSTARNDRRFADSGPDRYNILS